MKRKTPSEKKVVAEFEAVMEQLTLEQQKSVKALLKTIDTCDWSQIIKRKLKFSCRDYIRTAAAIENDAMQMRFEREDLNPQDRLLFLPTTVRAISDELENLKTEALLQDDDLALECLHEIAYESVKQLLTVTRAKLDKAAKIAVKQDAWPLPYANDSVTKKAAEELVKKLQVGSNRVVTTDASNVYSEITETRKWVGHFVELIDDLRRREAWTKKTYQELFGKEEIVKETILALNGLPNPDKFQDDGYDHYIQFIISVDVSLKFKAVLETENPFHDQRLANDFIRAAIALPPLSPEKTIIKSWAKVIREIVMKMHGEFPEKNPRLREIGEYLGRGLKAYRAENTQSYESNIRNGIFQRFEATLKSIAKG